MNPSPFAGMYGFYYGGLYKIMDVIDQNFLTINILDGTFRTFKYESLKDTNFRFVPYFRKNDLDIISDGEFIAFVKEFYLHREDGPALTQTSKGKLVKKLYLNGIPMEPEEYLESLPEEAQKKMVFELDKLQ